MDPTRQSLTDEQLSAASKELIVSYPKTFKQNIDPPVYGQSFANIAFILFPKEKIFMTKYGKPVYGYVKVRGSHPTHEAAYIDSQRIIREVDSKHQNKIGQVGAWLPITDDTVFIAELTDVGDESKKQLRSDAEREKEAEARRVQRELKDRQDEMQKTDIYDHPDTIAFYVMKRVTEMKLTETIAEFEVKLKDLLEKRIKVWRELRYLEQLNPSHVDGWLDVYNAERTKMSISAFVPGETQFADFEKYKPTADDLKDMSIDGIRGYKLTDIPKNPNAPPGLGGGGKA
jgi:hypothetical protein